MFVDQIDEVDRSTQFHIDTFRGCLAATAHKWLLCHPDICATVKTTECAIVKQEWQKVR